MGNSPFSDALEALEKIDALVGQILTRTTKESPAMVFVRVEELKKLTAESIKKLRPANFGGSEEGEKNA